MAHATSKKRVDQIMSKKVVTSSPAESIDTVSQRIRKHGYNCTPVIDKDGKVIGIITLTDINRAYGRSKK